MNGYMFMAERQKIEGATKTPVIILTAYNSMEPIFKRHGVKAYMVKPLRFDDFLFKIKEVLHAPGQS
jgi:CheY-like chemotaxis protein